MKNKNIIKNAAPLALILALGVGALSIQANEAAPSQMTDAQTPIIDLFEQKGTSVFEKIIGIVTRIETLEDGRQFVRIENSDGGETDFFIEDDTVFVHKEGIASFENIDQGEYVTAYYVQPLMMTMIYPAQYSANVLLLHGQSEYAGGDISLFDENGLNAEKDLYIHIGTDTVILNQSGEAYEGSLDNKVLAIFYDIVLESYPAQTTPSTIIVLDYTPDQFDDETPVIMDKLNPEDFANMIIFVNDTYLDNAAVHVNEDGEILFPLRAIAEALGFEVSWNEQLQKIVIGVAITINPDNTEYTMGRMAPQHMSVAPVIIDGTTYVPGDFITTALGAQIDISQGIYRITTMESEF